MAEFNDAVLRTHKYFPLSTVSLDNMGSAGQDYYYIGALSSTSILSNVVLRLVLQAMLFKQRQLIIAI